MQPSTNRLATDLSNYGDSSRRAFNAPISTPDLNLRLGRITKFDPYTLLCDLVLAGDNLELENVDRFANYSPTVGDWVWVLVSGPDLLVVDRAEGAPRKKLLPIEESANAIAGIAFGNNPKGPSVFAGTVAAMAPFSSTSQGYPRDAPIEGVALGGGGPKVTTNVGPSELVLVTLSVLIEIVDSLDGIADGTGIAAMEIAGTDGSFRITATPDYSGVVYSGPVGSGVAATRMAVFLTTSGTVDFQMRTASIGCTARFSRAQIGVVPL